MSDTKLGMGSDYLLNPYTKDPIELTENDLCRSTDTGFVQCDDVDLKTKNPWQVVIIGSLLLIFLMGLFSFQFEVVVDGELLFAPDTITANVLSVHPLIITGLAIFIGFSVGTLVKKTHLTRLILFDQ